MKAPLFTYAALTALLPLLLFGQARSPDIKNQILNSVHGCDEVRILDKDLAQVPERTGFWTKNPKGLLTLKSILELSEIEDLGDEDPNEGIGFNSSVGMAFRLFKKGKLIAEFVCVDGSTCKSRLPLKRWFAITFPDAPIEDTKGEVSRMFFISRLKSEIISGLKSGAWQQATSSLDSFFPIGK